MGGKLFIPDIDSGSNAWMRLCAWLGMDRNVALLWYVFMATIVSTVGLLGSCALPSGPATGLPAGFGMKVTVVLPGFPPPWTEADAWELSWESAAAAGGPALVVPGQVVELVLPRGSEAAVLCRAVFGADRSLPYGAVWPQGLSSEGDLPLSAAGGYAAGLAAVFYHAGMGHSGFDFQRFALEAGARLDDPWDLDPATLAVIVSERRFRVDHLNAPGRVAVSVSGLPGPLVSDSPWGQPAVPDESGAAIVEVPPGTVRRWLGGGYVLSVGVSSRDGPAWTLSGPAGFQSGIRITKTLPKPSLLVTDASPP